MPGCTDELWSLLLAMAQVPRAGSVAPGASAGVSWHAEQGWELQGRWDATAQEVFGLYKPVLDAGRGGDAWVIGQLGQSLDGCVATRSGDSCFINGPEILTHLHRVRALSDAVIVGAGTVACDNPRLTTRHVSGPHPTRVLLDPTLRLAPPGPVIASLGFGNAEALWFLPAMVAGAGLQRWQARRRAMRGGGLSARTRCAAEGVSFGGSAVALRLPTSRVRPPQGDSRPAHHPWG